MAECTRLESEQTVKGLGSSNLPLSASLLVLTSAFCLGLAGQAYGAETASVHGRVVDAAKRPVADFPLRVVDNEGRSIELRTGRDGSYAALGLAAGTIAVGLEGAGYERARSICHVGSGMVALANLVVRPGAKQTTERCRIEPPTSDLYIIE